MREPFAFGIDLDKLEAAWAFLTSFEVGFLSHADEHGRKGNKREQGIAVSHAADCGEFAAVVKDAAAALESAAKCARRLGTTEVPFDVDEFEAWLRSRSPG